MIQHADASWCAEFAPGDLEALRQAIPRAIHNSQERSARAHAAWADPDGDQDVYGAAMARGAQKELQTLLAELASYREVRVSGTRRALTYVGDALVFIHRVGKRMPLNHRRVRLAYLPDSRRELLQSASAVRYMEPGLFDLLDEAEPGPEAAVFSDVLEVVGRSSRGAKLFVPYFSSTPIGVGSIFWAPACLTGRHLEFVDPERLTYVQAPTHAPTLTPSRVTGGFAEGERPRTPTRLRGHSADSAHPASS